MAEQKEVRVNSEQLLLMLLGEKERDLAVLRSVVRQQSDQIKALQEKVSGLNLGEDLPHTDGG